MVLQNYYHTVISNNIINEGIANNGTTSTNYKYDCHIHMASAANILINNNQFNEILSIGDPNSSLNTFINLSSTTSRQRIINNSFRRKTSSINSYINTNKNSAFITDNYFDNFTIDGTSDALVSNIATNASNNSSLNIYSNNINQIMYVAIPLNSFSPSAKDSSNYIAYSANMQVSSAKSYVSPFVATTTTCVFVYNINFNAALPIGVKILEAKLGVYAINLGATLANDGINKLSIDIESADILTNNYTAGTNSILDVKNNINTTLETTSVDYDLFANLSSLTASTQYITINPSNLVYFTNTANVAMTGNITLAAHLSSAGSGIQYELSPLIVKCIW